MAIVTYRGSLAKERQAKGLPTTVRTGVHAQQEQPVQTGSSGVTVRDPVTKKHIPVQKDEIIQLRRSGEPGQAYSIKKRPEPKTISSSYHSYLAKHDPKTLRAIEGQAGGVMVEKVDPGLKQGVSIKTQMASMPGEQVRYYAKQGGEVGYHAKAELTRREFVREVGGPQYSKAPPSKLKGYVKKVSEKEKAEIRSQSFQTIEREKEEKYTRYSSGPFTTSWMDFRREIKKSPVATLAWEVMRGNSIRATAKMERADIPTGLLMIPGAVVEAEKGFYESAMGTVPMIMDFGVTAIGWMSTPGGDKVGGAVGGVVAIPSMVEESGRKFGSSWRRASLSQEPQAMTSFAGQTGYSAGYFTGEAVAVEAVLAGAFSALGSGYGKIKGVIARRKVIHTPKGRFVTVHDVPRTTPLQHYQAPGRDQLGRTGYFVKGKVTAKGTQGKTVWIHSKEFGSSAQLQPTYTQRSFLDKLFRREGTTTQQIDVLSGKTQTVTMIKGKRVYSATSGTVGGEPFSAVGVGSITGKGIDQKMYNMVISSVGKAPVETGLYSSKILKIFASSKMRFTEGLSLGGTTATKQSRGYFSMLDVVGKSVPSTIAKKAVGEGTGSLALQNVLSTVATSGSKAVPVVASTASKSSFIAVAPAIFIPTAESHFSKVGTRTSKVNLDSRVVMKQDTILNPYIASMSRGRSQEKTSTTDKEATASFTDTSSKIAMDQRLSLGSLSSTRTKTGQVSSQMESQVFRDLFSSIQVSAQRQRMSQRVVSRSPIASGFMLGVFPISPIAPTGRVAFGGGGMPSLSGIGRGRVSKREKNGYFLMEWPVAVTPKEWSGFFGKGKKKTGILW